jgi:hypothetical protein
MKASPENLAEDEGEQLHHAPHRRRESRDSTTVLDDCEIRPGNALCPDERCVRCAADCDGDSWDALIATILTALAAVLLYHLLPTVVESGDLPAPGNSTSVTTVNGQDILIEVDRRRPESVFASTASPS